MSALSAFLDDIMPDVPGASVALIQQAVRNACIELCRESLCYQHTPNAADIVAEQRDYVLVLPASTQVIDVLHAEVSDVEIFPKSDAQLDALYGVYGIDWRDIAVTGEVAYYQMTDQAKGTIRLVLTPLSAITGGLEVKLALAPARDASTVPDWLLTSKHEAIAHGAKHALFAMQKKPWSNADLAVFHGVQFEAAKGRADTATAKGNTRAPLRVSTCYR
jgi:hypothetical protein